MIIITHRSWEYFFRQQSWWWPVVSSHTSPLCREHQIGRQWWNGQVRLLRCASRAFAPKISAIKILCCCNCGDFRYPVECGDDKDYCNDDEKVPKDSRQCIAMVNYDMDDNNVNSNNGNQKIADNSYLRSNDNNVNDNDVYQWIADSSINGSLDGAMQEGGVLSERH